MRLAYASIGSGPPLVKASNWLTHLDFEWGSPIWRHWWAALSLHHRIVRYDERGNGMSQRDVGDVSFDTWVQRSRDGRRRGGTRPVSAARDLARWTDRDRVRGEASRARHAPRALRRLCCGAEPRRHARRRSKRAARSPASCGWDGGSRTPPSAGCSPAGSFPRPPRSTNSGSTSCSACPRRRRTPPG